MGRHGQRIPDASWQTGLFDAPTLGYAVRAIQSYEAHHLCLTVHYAKRIPSISYAFGLFEDDALVGVVTYGTPPSSTLCQGICGKAWQYQVLELNRLILRHNKPNEASRLVAASLHLLPHPSIVVSFADTGQGHEGIVYQAANFFYTGLSSAFRDPVVKGREHQHHATYAHGMTNAELREKYGAENVTFIDRSRKHRYITFVGSPTQRKALKRALLYPIVAYPKREATA